MSQSAAWNWARPRFASGKVHELKIWPQFFIDAKSGAKPFEVRKDDRDYAVGDRLVLREWSPATQSFTGPWVRVLVTYLMRSHGSPEGCLAPRWVIMGTTRDSGYYCVGCGLHAGDLSPAGRGRPCEGCGKTHYYTGDRAGGETWPE